MPPLSNSLDSFDFAMRHQFCKCYHARSDGFNIARTMGILVRTWQRRACARHFCYSLVILVYWVGQGYSYVPWAKQNKPCTVLLDNRLPVSPTFSPQSCQRNMQPMPTHAISNWDKPEWAPHLLGRAWESPTLVKQHPPRCLYIYLYRTSFRKCPRVLIYWTTFFNSSKRTIQ